MQQSMQSDASDAIIVRRKSMQSDAIIVTPTQQLPRSANRISTNKYQSDTQKQWLGKVYKVYKKRPSVKKCDC